MTSERDRVDAILDHLAARDPGADLSRQGVHIRVRRLSHWLETESRRRLAPLGMEFWELTVLSSLERSGGSMTVGALQDDAQLTSGAISQRVAKLEAAGAVQRTFAAHDRRQVNVELTESGRQRLEAITTTVHDVERDLFAQVDQDLLVQLADNLRAVMLATEGGI